MYMYVNGVFNNQIQMHELVYLRNISRPSLILDVRSVMIPVPGVPAGFYIISWGGGMPYARNSLKYFNIIVLHRMTRLPKG